MDGFVGAVVSNFKLAVGTVFQVGPVVEAAIGERSAEPFMEEEKWQPDLDTFCGETVSVTGTVTLDQIVSLEFAQVVAQLVQAVKLYRRGRRW